MRAVIKGLLLVVRRSTLIFTSKRYCNLKARIWKADMVFKAWDVFNMFFFFFFFYRSEKTFRLEVATDHTE